MKDQPPADLRFRHRRLARDLAWGVCSGLSVAAVFILIAGVQYVRYLFTGGQGTSELQRSVLEEVPIWKVVAFYLGAAVVSGTILGLLRPLTRSWLGTVTVGFLCAVPVIVGGTWFLGWLGRPTVGELVLFLGLAAFYGLLGGTVFRYFGRRVAAEIELEEKALARIEEALMRNADGSRTSGDQDSAKHI